MAFLTSIKAKGRRYFYLAQYTGGKSYSKKRYKHIYSFGNEKIAFERFSLWSLDSSFIPKELLEVGIQISHIEDWKERVKNTTDVH